MALIVTADDFGRDAQVNEAVREAYEAGVLNAASLMVTGEAWEEAVALAQEMPGLAVGLHLVLSDGHAALPAGEISHLVDREGRFADSPARAGWTYWNSWRARRELVREIAAQFDRFAATGLSLAHVDGHQHLHMHPAVFDIVLAEAQRRGAGRIRVPHEELGLALRFGGGARAGKIATLCAFRWLEWRARRRLHRTGLPAPVRTYGFLMSGRMNAAYVEAVLKQVEGRSAEIYFHPRTQGRVAELGPNPGDLACLVGGRVHELLSRYGSDAAARRDEVQRWSLR